MAGHSGIKASFHLAGPALQPIVPDTDLSRWLKSISKTVDSDELDATTFQPDGVPGARENIGGFDTKSMTLTGNWSAAAHTFLAPLGLSKPQGLDYTYAPLGPTIGLPEITGKCNLMSYNGPSEVTVDGVIEFTVELSITSEVAGTVAVVLRTGTEERKAA